MTTIQLSENALFPIREVSRLTGVNPITLRAWERRYNLIEPIRTDSGHRLYNQNHIDTLKQVVSLTKQGVPISRVKPMLSQPKTTTVEPSTEQQLMAQLKQAIGDADIPKTNQLMDELLADYPFNDRQALLQNLTLELKKNSDPTDLRFWEALNTPRLYSRLHLKLRSQQFNLKTIAVFCFSDSSPVTKLLVALSLSRQGMYPLLLDHAIMNENLLLETLQHYHCHGIALVDDSGKLDLTFWQQWSKTHPSFELHLFLNQNEPEWAERLQVQYVNLNSRS